MAPYCSLYDKLGSLLVGSFDADLSCTGPLAGLLVAEAICIVIRSREMPPPT